ncbi:hypothetical protein TNCV_1313921 [Trichonephila clavipes]|nr:hypothetical protein TNCV_1313921 [Trichonephila clavipes]
MSWCPVADTPYNNFRRTCCMKPRYFVKLRHSGSICISTHSLGHSFRLAHYPRDGYYCPEVNVAYDAMPYGDLLSPCCLLSRL